MLNFLDLNLQNFMSHKDTHIQLDRQGLVLLSGKMLGDPSANSNGAGKSALLPEGLLYALFNRTLRGSRGEDVVHNETGKNCIVTLNLTTDTGDYVSIQRVQKAGTLRPYVSINGEKHYGADEITRVVEEVLGLRFETFAATAIYGKGDAKFFTQLTDESRKKILDDLMAFQDINGFSEISKKGATNLRESCDAIDVKIRNRKAKMEGLAINLEEFKKNEREFESQRQEELKKAAENLQAVVLSISTIEGQIEKFLADFQALEEKHDLNKKLLEKTNKELEDLREQERTWTGELVQKRTLLEVSSKEHDRFQRLVVANDATCPTCYQGIPSRHKEAIRKTLQTAVERALKELSRVKTGLEPLSGAMTTAKKLTEAANTQLQETDRTMGQVKVDLARLRQIRTQQKEQEVSLKAGIEKLENAVNTAGEVVKRTQELIANEQKELAALEEQEKKFSSLMRYVDFWVEGFSNRGIKSMMLDQVIPFLNERAAAHSSLLTDGTIRVSFSTQSTTKANELRDKFDVIVEHSMGGKNYRTCSDGQRRRADVIATLALGDLAAARVSSPINIAILDEIFDGLDDTGIECSLPLLVELSRQRGSVFVITHHDQMAQYFPKVWTCTYENGSTRVGTA